MSYIFEAGFNDGTFGTFTPIASGSTVTVDSNAALAGSSHGVLINFASTPTSGYVRKIVIAPDIYDIRTRFYFHPGYMAFGSSTYVRLFTLYAGSTQLYSLRWYGDNRMRVGWAHDSGTGISSYSSAGGDASEHYFEMEMWRALTNGGGNGGFALWVDDSLLLVVSTIANYNSWTNVPVPPDDWPESTKITRAEYGFITTSGSTGAGSLYIDEIAMRDEIYGPIGPYVPSLPTANVDSNLTYSPVTLTSTTGVSVAANTTLQLGYISFAATAETATPGTTADGDLYFDQVDLESTVSVSTTVDGDLYFDQVDLESTVSVSTTVSWEEIGFGELVLEATSAVGVQSETVVLFEPIFLESLVGLSVFTGSDLSFGPIGITSLVSTIDEGPLQLSGELMFDPLVPQSEIYLENTAHFEKVLGSLELEAEVVTSVTASMTGSVGNLVLEAETFVKVVAVYNASLGSLTLDANVVLGVLEEPRVEKLVLWLETDDDIKLIVLNEFDVVLEVQWMNEKFDVGDKPKVYGYFTNNEMPYDPSVVVAQFRHEGGLPITPVVSKESTGVYYFEMPLTAPGVWYYRMSGDDSAAEQGQLYANPNLMEI